MASTAPDRDQFIAEVQVAMAKHKPDRERQCCACGFCVYSAQHAMIMAVQEVWPRHFNVR